MYEYQPLDLSVKKNEPPAKKAKTCEVPIGLSPTYQYSPISDHSDYDLTDHNQNYKTTPAPTLPKATRPFKAYPKDPLAMALHTATPDVTIAGKTSAEAFAEFREKMLAQVEATTSTNKNMRRTPPNPQNPRHEDPNYWEKRQKNNQAAKRSRDARRKKEDEIAIRCAFLETENLQLRVKLDTSESEIERLHAIIYDNPR